DEIDRRFFGPGTRAALQQFQIDHELPPTGVVDEATGAELTALPVAPVGGPSITSFADKPIGANGNIRPPDPHLVAPSSAIAVREESFVVGGRVWFADGTPAAGATVCAHDCDLRRMEALGKPVTTGEDGRYEIHYTAVDFARAENRRADLRV